MLFGEFLDTVISGARRVESMLIEVRDVEPGASVHFREPVVSKLDIRGAKARAVFVP